MALAAFILPSQARFASGQIVVTIGINALIEGGRLDPAPMPCPGRNHEKSETGGLGRPSHGLCLGVSDRDGAAR